MRKRADWMRPIDDIILELVEEEGQYPPKIIAEKIDRHPKYVGTRCRALRDRGFLKNLGRGLYQITDQGRKYLEGEFDASDVDDDGERRASA